MCHVHVGSCFVCVWMGVVSSSLLSLDMIWVPCVVLYNSHVIVLPVSSHGVFSLWWGGEGASGGGGRDCPPWETSGCVWGGGWGHWRYATVSLHRHYSRYCHVGLPMCKPSAQQPHKYYMYTRGNYCDFSKSDCDIYTKIACIDIASFMAFCSTFRGSLLLSSCMLSLSCSARSMCNSRSWIFHDMFEYLLKFFSGNLAFMHQWSPAEEHELKQSPPPPAESAAAETTPPTQPPVSSGKVSVHLEYTYVSIVRTT